MIQNLNDKLLENEKVRSKNEHEYKKMNQDIQTKMTNLETSLNNANKLVRILYLNND